MIARTEGGTKKIYQINYNKNKENKVFLISKFINGLDEYSFDLEFNTRVQDLLFDIKYGSLAKSVSIVHRVSNITYNGVEVSKNVYKISK